MTKLFLTTGRPGEPREIIAGPFDSVADALIASASLGQRLTVERVPFDPFWIAPRYMEQDA